jgi:hypothetical protein
MEAHWFGELADYRLIEPEFLVAVRATNDPA